MGELFRSFVAVAEAAGNRGPRPRGYRELQEALVRLRRPPCDEAIAEVLRLIDAATTGGPEWRPQALAYSYRYVAEAARQAEALPPGHERLVAAVLALRDAAEAALARKARSAW